MKIHFIECYGYGYGVGLFYPNLLFYFPALLVLCGMSLAIAYKIFAFCLIVGIFLTTYYSSWKITQDKESALLAAIIMILSSKILNAFYVGMSLGIITGAVFMPLAIAGMYLFLTRNQSIYMLVIGFVGLIFSHTITTLFSLIICSIIVLINLKELWKNKKKIIALVFSVCIVALITASYWLSMLEQMHCQLLKVAAPWTTSEQNVETFSKMFQRDGIGIMILFVLAVCIGLILWLRVRMEDYKLAQRKMGISIFLGIAIIFVILPMCRPFWHFMNSTLKIRIIQFPYRLYVPASLLIAFGAAGCYSLLKNQINIKMRIVRSICFLSVFILGLGSSYLLFSQYYENESIVVEQIVNGEIAGLGGGEEWLPINTTREYMSDANMAIDNENNHILGKKERGFSEFTFTADLSKEYYDIPYIYYKGYRAYTIDGERLDTDQNYLTGMVRVYMPKNSTGNKVITVKYVTTKYQRLGYIATFIGVSVLALYIFMKKTLKTKKLCCLHSKN